MSSGSSGSGLKVAIVPKGTTLIWDMWGGDWVLVVGESPRASKGQKRRRSLSRFGAFLVSSVSTAPACSTHLLLWVTLEPRRRLGKPLLPRLLSQRRRNKWRK